MKAARDGTKDSLEKTKLAMIRKVSFLQRKEPTGTQTEIKLSQLVWLSLINMAENMNIQKKVLRR